MNLSAFSKPKKQNKILLIANSENICLNSVGYKEIRFLDGITSGGLQPLFAEIDFVKGVLADFQGEITFNNETIANIDIHVINSKINDNLSRISLDKFKIKEPGYFFLKVTKNNGCKCLVSTRIYGVKI